MLKEPDPIPLLPGEEKAGFSVLTLVYPETYELPLKSQTKARYERAVALLIDDENRFRRATTTDRYVHEVCQNGCWVTAQEFETLSDLRECPIYSSFPR